MHEIDMELKIGAAAPFAVFHISDTHLTLCDERDGAATQAFAARRSGLFPQGRMDLTQGANLARESGGFLVHTGDLIDFVSAANLDAARGFVREHNCLFTAGEREFCMAENSASDAVSGRFETIGRVQAAFGMNIRFSSRVIYGVNFVGIDNSDYRIEAWQLSRLWDEVRKGFPIVLCMHTPVYTPDLFEYAIGGNESAGLMCVPQALMRGYSDFDYLQQRDNADTREAYRYLLSCPEIRLILTGHLHFDYETVLADRVPQFVTGCGTARRIILR